METHKAREPWRLTLRLVFPGDKWITEPYVVKRIFSVSAENRRAAQTKAVREIIPNMKELLRQEGYKGVTITVVDL